LWSGYDEQSAFDLNGGGPVWIIRNGVNDLAQNNKTDFNSFHHLGTVITEDANGNGAVCFGIAPKTSGELTVSEGKFDGPVDSTTLGITFTTDGYEDEAEVYYAVVPHDEENPGVPGYSDYTLLDTVTEGEWSEEISLPEDQEAGGNYDIYVLVYKEGEVSAPIIINTLEGKEDVDWYWGDEPYKSYYVASMGSGGDDTNPGTKEAPLGTVQEALEKLAAAYSADNAWPGKGSAKERPGGIIILDTVEVAEQITVDGGAGYPPITLSDDPKMPAGSCKQRRL
jgi:hypothetical protein